MRACPFGPSKPSALRSFNLRSLYAARSFFVGTINYNVLATFVNLCYFHIALLSSVTPSPRHFSVLFISLGANKKPLLL
jgi:hypothetical protein